MLAWTAASPSEESLQGESSSPVLWYDMYSSWQGAHQNEVFLLGVELVTWKIRNSATVGKRLQDSILNKI